MRYWQSIQIASARPSDTNGENAPPAMDRGATSDPTEPRRPQLYSRKRRGYLRATIEDGIRVELDEMSAEARGTPFFTTTITPRSEESIAERLARLGGTKR